MLVVRFAPKLTHSHLVNYQWQSNGHCFDNCKASYAFAIVQGENCWCTNYAPADTTSLGSCNMPCPGFPFESCGSNDTFGYIALNKAPLGTVGASESQSSTSSPAQAPTSISQVVSSPTSPQAVLHSSSFLAKVSSSLSKTIAAQLSSGNLFRASAFQQPSTSTVLTPSTQTTSLMPKPVTVHQTVTASPSVKISLVPIVFNPYQFAELNLI